jgi:hypothetical protein
MSHRLTTLSKQLQQSTNEESNNGDLRTASVAANNVAIAQPKQLMDRERNKTSFNVQHMVTNTVMPFDVVSSFNSSISMSLVPTTSSPCAELLASWR